MKKEDLKQLEYETGYYVWLLGNHSNLKPFEIKSEVDELIARLEIAYKPIGKVSYDLLYLYEVRSFFYDVNLLKYGTNEFENKFNQDIYEAKIDTCLNDYFDKALDLMLKEAQRSMLVREDFQAGFSKLN